MLYLAIQDQRKAGLDPLIESPGVRRGNSAIYRFILTCADRNRESPNIEKQSPAIRRKKLGTYVVTKTNRKFVGPTDYAGAALRFRRPGVTGKNDGKDDLYVLLIDYRNVSSC